MLKGSSVVAGCVALLVASIGGLLFDSLLMHAPVSYPKPAPAPALVCPLPDIHIQFLSKDVVELDIGPCNIVLNARKHTYYQACPDRYTEQLQKKKVKAL